MAMLRVKKEIQPLLPQVLEMIRCLHLLQLIMATQRVKIQPLLHK